MNTKTGTFRILDSLFPARSPHDIYKTEYNAVLVASRMNGSCGMPRRFLVTPIGGSLGGPSFSCHARSL